NLPLPVQRLPGAAEGCAGETPAHYKVRPDAGTTRAETGNAGVPGGGCTSPARRCGQTGQGVPAVLRWRRIPEVQGSAALLQYHVQADFMEVDGRSVAHPGLRSHQGAVEP